MAPQMAPSNCADHRLSSCAHAPVEMATESVMAGLRLAPGLPKACAPSTPQSTPSAQPVVITIQPESAAYDLRSVTPALTPLPSRMSTSVPRNSPIHVECRSGDIAHLASRHTMRSPDRHRRSAQRLGLRNASIVACRGALRQVEVRHSL